MIKLHQFARTWGIANLSPFCCKPETYLRIADIPYQVVTTIPTKAPKGKLPFIEDNNKKISDSDLIIQHLKQAYGDKLDADLNASEKAVSLSMHRLLEDHLFWIVLYTRWHYTEDNWQVNKKAIFTYFPPLISSVVAKVYRILIRRQIRGHGIARHSNDEIFQLGRNDIDALSDFLSNKPYFMGKKPTSLDAAAYGFLVNTLVCPIESPVKEYALSKQNLVDFCQRISSEYYPELSNAHSPNN